MLQYSRPHTHAAGRTGSVLPCGRQLACSTSVVLGIPGHDVLIPHVAHCTASSGEPVCSIKVT